MMPKRIQRKRTKGWKKPIGAVNVARPGKWGNPFKVGDGHCTAEEAKLLYSRDLLKGYLGFTVYDVRLDLAGKDLMCWCSLDAPCHADVLLEIANAVKP
jgi:hypothetical protein